MNGKKSQVANDHDRHPQEGLYVMATGGGAYKFYDKIRSRLGVEIYREDEMECLIVGELRLSYTLAVEVADLARIGLLHHRDTRGSVCI